MKHSLRRPLLLLGAIACALLVAYLAMAFLLGRAPGPSEMPDPNGYNDLLTAAQSVTGSLDDVAALDRDGLRAVVASNGQALQVLRLGLSRRCAVPTRATIANFSSISGDLIGLKSLAKLLFAEGRLAEMEGRPGDAARSYLDSIRLGTEISRGGLMINRMVGIGCEGMGSTALAKLIPQLPCDHLQTLAAQLEQADTNTVAWDGVLRAENCFVRAQAGRFPIMLVKDWWEARNIRKTGKERHDLAAAHVRLLATELALRSYRCEQATAPANLQQLVLKYLKQLPVDPFSDRPLVYRPSGTNWILYSLGPDRVDDGGKPLGKIITGGHGLGPGKSGSTRKAGDLFYDSPW